MKNVIAFKAFLAVLIGVVMAVAVPPVKGAAQPRQKRMSYDEITTRIASLQGRADSLTAVLEQLRQDSTRAAQEQARQNAGQSKKQADIEESVAKKRALATAAKAQYDKARADSNAIMTKTRDQIVAFHKELQQSEASLTALNNELALLIERQDKINAPSGNADEKSVNRLQVQAGQRDSAVRARQADAGVLTAKRDKLRQDSLQAEAKRGAESVQFHQQAARIDGMIATCDTAILQLEQKQTAVKSEKEQKAAQLQQNIVLFAKQKQSIAEQINRANAELIALQSEQNRLQQSSGAAKQKYDALRLPFESAYANADTAMQRATKEKQLLLALRQKFSIDSSIFKARDDLDRAIQAEAEKKKGGKKLVEQRENELDVLLQKQDSINRAVPGLRLKESQFRAPTNSLKTALIDSALAQGDKKISAATVQRDKTRQSLAAFEQKNPEPQNSSGARLAQLDNLIGEKKKEAIQLTSASDSLNILLQELQGSELSTKGKDETGKADSALQNKKSEKTTLVAKRTKVQRDSAQSDAASAASMTKIRAELTSANNQILIAQNEVTLLTADRDKTRMAIIAAQEKNRQSTASMTAEKRKVDSLSSAKQEEISLLSAKIDKIRKDSSAAVRQQDQQIRSIVPSPSSLAGLAATLDRELLLLQMQRDSLTRASLAGSHGNDAERKIAVQIATVSRSIESTQGEIVAMNAMKDEATKRLKEDKIYYDSLVNSTEQELAGLIAKRDRARLDSTGAETNVRQSSVKIASMLKMHDSSIAVRQKELSDITAEYNRIADDNARAPEKENPAMQGFSQSMKSIDAQILAKEREIVDLKAKKDKVKQDSIAESRRQAGLLAAAHAEIVKRNAAVEQKKTEVALAIAEKKKAQADTGSIQRKSLEAVTAATLEIQQQNDLIGTRQAELAKQQKERDAVVAKIRATSERGGGVVITDEPAPPASKSPTSTPAELAQKKAEEIYTLLGENKVADASKRFKSLQQFFKTNLDPESFTALKTTIEQMGGAIK